jgi:hypothetical protein
MGVRSYGTVRLRGFRGSDMAGIKDLCDAHFGKVFHSSTFRLNISAAVCGIWCAFWGCFGGV